VETIDQVYEERKSSRDIFEKMESDNHFGTTIFRWVAWMMNVGGHYLLFSPVIKLFAWIPLVGFLLGGVVKFAAISFSLVWATALHLLILSVAWIFYRPLYGLTMLAACAGCVFMMFHFHK